jgi:hypothetical protein
VEVRQEGDNNRKMIGVKMGTDRPGERRKKMGRSKRDVRGRRRSVTIRETSRRVRIKDTEFTGFEDRGKEVTTRVAGVPWRKPT